MELYPYQTDVVNLARGEFIRGLKSIVLVMPTGSGKTATVSHMIASSVARENKVLIIVHRRELVAQVSRALALVNVPHGFITADKPIDLGHPVQIAMVQTLSRRLDKLDFSPSLVVFDECHHLCASNWTKVFNRYVSAYKIGLTATPIRLDGKGLATYFDKIVGGPAVRWLIDNNYLCDYKYFAPSSISTKGLHIKMGDFVKSEVNELIGKSKIVGDSIKEYTQRAAGKRAVVFCNSVEFSLSVVEQFKQQGISAEHVDGESTDEHRAGAISRFKSGETKILCNVDLFGEGFDLPAIECVIMLRPTKSLSLYLQQIGRALRRSENKSHAIIIDHVGNVFEHGLPCDIREWSLEGITKKNKALEIQIKTCPMCYAAFKSTVIICEHCGYNFSEEKKKKTKMLNEFSEGELVELVKSSFKINEQHQTENYKRTKLKIDLRKAKTHADYVEIAKLAGYKKGWAWYMFNLKNNKR